MSFTGAAKNSLLNEWIVSNFTHITLMNGPTTNFVDYSNELGYRAPITWDVSDGIASNSNSFSISITGSDVKVTHVGLTTNGTLSSGSISYSIPLLEPIEVSVGGKVEIAAGDLKVQYSNNGPTLGYNLEPTSVGTFGWQFLNCFKAGFDVSGTLSVMDDGRPINRDANGWPASLLPGQVVRWHVPTYYSGVYRLEWGGTGTLVVENGTSVTSTGSNSLTFTANAQETIRIRWDAVGPVDVTCVHSSDTTEFDNGAVFIDRFVEFMQEATVLRFAESLSIQNLPVNHTVNDRSLPTDSSEGVDSYNYGYSIESMCELCNEADADLWYCLPPYWDDGNYNNGNSQTPWNRDGLYPGVWTENQVNEVARVIKDNLNPHLRVYIEHGNRAVKKNDEFAAQFQYLADRSSLLGIPTYLADGTRTYSDSIDRVYSYHAWRTAQAGKEFKRILGNRRVTTVLAMESGDHLRHARVHRFLTEQKVLKDIDAIALNPLLGDNEETSISASYMLESFDEALVIDISNSIQDPVSTPLNLRFVFTETGKVKEFSFYNGGDWDGGSDRTAARTLAESLHGFRPGFRAFNIGSRVILATPGWVTTALATPPSMTVLPAVDEQLITDLLKHNFNNRLSRQEHLNNVKTAELFNKEVLASEISLRDVGGDASLASLRENLFDNDDRGAILSAMILQFRDLATQYPARYEQATPSPLCVNTRWGGEDYANPNVLRAIVKEYSALIAGETSVFHSVTIAATGRDRNLTAQGAINNVVADSATVGFTNLNLLDANFNALTTAISFPNAEFATVDNGKRTNSNDITFSPTASAGEARYLGFYDGSTLVATAPLTTRVLVENGVDITIPANSLIVAG